MLLSKAHLEDVTGNVGSHWKNDINRRKNRRNPSQWKLKVQRSIAQISSISQDIWAIQEILQWEYPNQISGGW
jgi:hypothetical protein